MRTYVDYNEYLIQYIFYLCWGHLKKKNCLLQQSLIVQLNLKKKNFERTPSIKQQNFSFVFKKIAQTAVIFLKKLLSFSNFTYGRYVFVF